MIKKPTAHSKEHMEYLKNKRRRATLITATQVFIFVLFFGIWEVAANMKWIDPFIFSQPTRIAKTFAQMVLDKTLFVHIGVTLGETIVGFLLSTVLGTLISIFLWWNSFFEKVLSPYLVVLNSLPKTALAPIIIVWLGNNVNAVIATAVMTSIIVTILTVLTGFYTVSREKLKLVQTFGGTKKQALFKVVLPASVPTIVNALKINIGLSFVGVIVGEFLVAKAGLGYLIVYGSQIFICVYIQILFAVI